MHYLMALAQRKTRLAALIVIALGLGILAMRGAGGSAPAPAAASSVDAPGELLAQDEPFAQDAALMQDEPAPAEPSASADAPIVVYVSGAVLAPDVYQLPPGARLKDLVVAAGGLSPDAAPELINLAGRLSDGQHVHVPRQGETPATAEPAVAAGASESSDLIDINSASAAELDELDGIGQAIAERIIEYRSANGPFKAPEDLRNVKGIGPALFDKLADQITVGPAR